MPLEDLINDSNFASGLLLINQIDNKKFVRLVDWMMKDFNPHRLPSFTDHELESLEKSLKLTSDQVQGLLGCLNQLLKQVISDVIKPAILKDMLSDLFSLEINKVETFCTCWAANAQAIVTRLQQNYNDTLRLVDFNWALNISSNVKNGLSEPEPRALLELKVEDHQTAGGQKVKEIYLDLTEEELQNFYSMLENIKLKLEQCPHKV
ncbi:COMM domain-containing protein 10-like [Adelges cooleyi]|uniref:COMM domain-containing protein 10-like n=1 Tax=Adelges cooleyi TaxID=133065 RepID=UPI00217F8FA1|nr:COMM domain-containing protein 10-like [Adelges cooleyi]